MIRYLIKNNLKLMLRSKWTIVTLIFGPVLVITILSSAFEELLKSYEGVDEFKAGYRLEEGSFLKSSMEMIKEAGKEAGIIFLEYPEGEPEKLMEGNELAGFVEVKKDKFTIYESADYEAEGVLLEYFLSRLVKEGTKQVLQETIPNIGNEKLTVPKKTIAYMPAVDSRDYYGIIEIVYFSWISIICMSNVFTSEKKNGIERKFQVTAVSDGKLYAAKWISTVLVTAFGIGISTILSILLFDIHWGEPFLSAIQMLFLIMASSAFGLMVYYICKNIAITVIVVFVIDWFMGFFGGSFETYMFSSTPDVLKNASPIYHVNRALVEYSCMGHSAYTYSSLRILLGICLLCSIAAVIADKIRKRGRA